jgi:hypothetical protein
MKARFATLAVLAVAALGIEMTVAGSVRAESQSVADAAALAGAGRLVIDPADAVAARQTALRYVRLNPVRGHPLELKPEDVAVELDSLRVTVRVRARVLRLPVPVAWLRVTAESTAELITEPYFEPDIGRTFTRVLGTRLIDEKE